MAACNNSPSETNTIQPTTTEVETTPIITTLPQENIDQLGYCTGVEITFYKIGGSISSGNCGTFFNFLEGSAPTTLIKEEFGHITFMVNGRLYSLAKIHIQDQTGYLKFDINKEYYYHSLNKQGIDFFTGINFSKPESN
jgi:hypothetical protein